MQNKNLYRYERKFLISDLDNHSVEKIIKLNTMNFSTLYPSRAINNIYFDSIKMKCFHDNIEGIPNREKIRIRWYGNTLGEIKKPVLEIKIRKNSVGTKQHYALPAFNMSKSLTETQLKKIIINANIPDIVKESVLSRSPTIVNGYIRKYFISFDKKFRATIDNDLFYIKAKSKIINTTEKYFDRKNTVLEIKYDTEDDKDIDLITRQFNFRMTKNSKYTTGIYRLYF